jgi:hypothetical protein
VFLCVSGTKELKTDEKRAKFIELAESVPQLSENVRIGPWRFILEKSQQKSPRNQEMTLVVLGVKFL